MAAGITAPRDTDLQEEMLGAPVEGGVAGAAPSRRSRLLAQGHVGIMIDGEYLLHANGHHMAVVIEPLAEVVARIAGKTASRPACGGSNARSPFRRTPDRQ